MLIRFVGELHRRGVTLTIGTDAIPGFALHREIELYVKAGIPPSRPTWSWSRAIPRAGSRTSATPCS